jgi:hypothetical protein
MEQFSEPQVNFGTTFRVAGSYLNTGTSFLKRVIRRIFIIRSDLIEASRTLFLVFSIKRQPNIAKIISIHTKSTDLDPQTKYSSRDTFPLTSFIFSSGPDRPAAGQGEVLQEAD